MTYQQIITQVSKDLNLSYDIVDKTYKSFWLFVRHSIQSLPLKEDLTEEEFNALKTNINIPSLGKFNCTYNRYLGVKERFKYIKHIKNDKKEN